MNRRGFLVGVGALICAPAIVKAANIMPVKVLDRYSLGDWKWKIQGWINAEDLIALKGFMQRHHVPPAADGYYHAIGPTRECPYIITHGRNSNEQWWHTPWPSHIIK